jgi:prepilin-type N-terminal cleavage/methylation domain-containing protein
MASPSTYVRNSARGFTLMEIIIVIGLLVVIAGFALVVSLDDYRGYNFRNERDVVVAVLQKARSQAINNMCFEDTGSTCSDGVPHGVYFGTAGQYVIFQGASYASRDQGLDEVIEAGAGSVVAAGMSSVVFERLSGDASVSPANSTLTLTDERGKTSVFTVEGNGRIWWTN